MKIALSPSRMADMACPYLFDAKHIAKTHKETESPEMKIGHEVHEFIAEYERHCIENKLSRDKDFYWRCWDRRKALGAWTDCARAEEIAKIYFRSEASEIHIPEGSDWVMVEKQMCFDQLLMAIPDDDAWFDTSGKTMFRLIVDYAYRQGDTIRIIDHKTGRATPTPEQLNIYAALVPLYVPPLDMGGVWSVEPIYNLVGGFKPDSVRLDVMTLKEAAAGLLRVREALQEVNSWPEKYKEGYPATPCGLCQYCTLPTCPVRKEVEGAIKSVPAAPVFDIPDKLEDIEQAKKAVTFVTFIGQLEKKLKDLLKSYVDQNGPVVSGGMQAAYAETESFEIPDMQALIDLLSAYGCTQEQIMKALSITKTDLQKLIKKAGLKDRMPMIEQLTVSKTSRRFGVKKAA